MNTNIKAIIFDCDGVLVDSEYSHYLSWVHAFKQQGSDLPLEDYYSYVGKSSGENARLFAEKIGLDCAKQLLEDKRAYYHQLQADGIPSIDSTLYFVRQLAEEKKRLGISLAVASAAKKHNILFNLKYHALEECFDLVLSGQDDLMEYHDPEGVNKPKPYIYLHAAKLLGVSPEQCVVIEDSHSGVSAAVNAGCFTIAVPNRFTQKQELSHATLKLSSFSKMRIDQFFSIFNAMDGEGS